MSSVDKRARSDGRREQSAATLASIARQLDRINEPRARAAAAILRAARPGGRPQLNDEEAVDETLALVAMGAARSIGQAAQLVANSLSGQQSIEAAAKRIARKSRSKRDMFLASRPTNE